jgi:prepilin-type N-terminal cleavage/methylation domain-containing protein
MRPRGYSFRLSRQGAFTLIEVLITLVILSTGIVLVLQAFETAAVALGDSRDAMRASSLARDKLEDALADDPEAAPGTSGSFPTVFGGFRWRVLAAPAEMGGEGELERLTVDVWREGRQVVYTLGTLRAKAPGEEARP